MLRPDGPTYEVILEEFVVRRLNVPVSVMGHQLRHLADIVAGQPNVTLRVLPYNARLVGGLLPKSSFALYTFADPAMAVAETINSDLVYTDPSETQRYEGHYSRLRLASLPAADSKLIRSKTKFWQMIGLGTRLRPDLFGPGQDKKQFLVFDLARNVEFFDSDIPEADGRVQPSLGERLFAQRAELLYTLHQL